MRKLNASITVFFSLLSVVFLAFTFTIVEAVRISGARAQCTDLAAIANWTLFSEYENGLLEKYDLFGIDTGFDSGTFSTDYLIIKLKASMLENTDLPGDAGGKLPGMTFDPWKLSLRNVTVSQYALLSDRGGEPYYQQAVEFMHKTAWMNALGKLQDAYRDATTAHNAQEQYQQDKSSDAESSGSLLSELSDSYNKEMEEEYVPTPEEIRARSRNPISKISSLRSQGLLKLVCGSRMISDKKLSPEDLASQRSKNHGSLSLHAPRGGSVDDLLFREYLLDHFPDFIENAETGTIRYQMEYILCGKTSDEKNLKAVIEKLIGLREAVNYSILVSTPAANMEAQTFAALIVGCFGSPALVQALKHTLLLLWAYGESLYDVRMLVHDGRVPAVKTFADWHIPLEDLIDIEVILPRADRDAGAPGAGMSYQDYIRVFLNMGSVTTQKKRSLDLVELNLRASGGCPNFRVDNCVVAITGRSSWLINPVFSTVPAVFLGTASRILSDDVESGFRY